MKYSLAFRSVFLKYIYNKLSYADMYQKENSLYYADDGKWAVDSNKINYKTRQPQHGLSPYLTIHNP